MEKAMYEINEISTIPTAIGEDLELRDIFYTNNKKRSVYQVKLNSKGICLRSEVEGGSKVLNVNLCDIIGSRCVRSDQPRSPFGKCTCRSSPTSYNRNSSAADDVNVDSSAYLYVFAYVLKKRNLRSKVQRERTVLTLRFRTFDKFEDNIKEAEKWYRLIKWHKKALLHIEPSMGFSEERRFLVLLNPKSGLGKARTVFLQQVVPVLNEAEIPYDLFVTKYANYAREFIRMKNISNWAGIIAVGGDGLAFEIINGLMQRIDWETVLRIVPIGIIPSGSGNGLAKAIAHLYKEPFDPKPVLGATLTILSGHTSLMDIVRIVFKNEQVLFSFLSVGWGLISDVDIESERLRSIGYSRFTLWTLHRLVSLRTYRGKLSYRPKTECFDNESEIKDKLPNSSSLNTFFHRPDNSGSSEFINHSEFEDVMSLETSVNHSIHSRCDSWFSAGSCRSNFYSIPESIYHSIAGDSSVDESGEFRQSAKYVGPPATEPLDWDSIPDGWVVEEGDFIMVHAAYQTHLGSDCFFSPSSKLNDGTIYLVIIRGGTSRAQLFNFLVNMSSGTHLPTKNNSSIKVVPVTAFRIEPYDEEGIITVDGERVEFGPLQAEILPGLAKVMVPK